jgi:hypothetical protein
MSLIKTAVLKTNGLSGWCSGTAKVNISDDFVFLEILENRYFEDQFPFPFYIENSLKKGNLPPGLVKLVTGNTVVYIL